MLLSVIILGDACDGGAPGNRAAFQWPGAEGGGKDVFDNFGFVAADA